MQLRAIVFFCLPLSGLSNRQLWTFQSQLVWPISIPRERRITFIATEVGYRRNLFVLTAASLIARQAPEADLGLDQPVEVSGVRLEINLTRREAIPIIFLLSRGGAVW